jgi:hypothetical protein
LALSSVFQHCGSAEDTARRNKQISGKILRSAFKTGRKKGHIKMPFFKKVIADKKHTRVI